MRKSKKGSFGRRGFLKGAAAGAAAFVAGPVAGAQQAPPAQSARAVGIVPPAGAVAAETEVAPPLVDVLTQGRPGADFMVDVIKSLGVDYICANPGSSFRGLHESVVNYGGNTKPQFITCMHEEISVAMADGYAQVEGKPLMVFAHGTVGLQHASMAVYNSFCGRIPIFIILGNSLDATTRRPGVEWKHSVQDAAAMVRAPSASRS